METTRASASDVAFCIQCPTEILGKRPLNWYLLLQNSLCLELRFETWELDQKITRIEAPGGYHFDGLICLFACFLVFSARVSTLFQ